jgi:hypothetical protein
MMLANCSNPSCSVPFRHLRDGKLFRVESDPVSRSVKSNRGEYFWLCDRCSSTVSLRLGEEGAVVTVQLPEAFRGTPADVAFSLLDHKNGLLLYDVNSQLSKRGRRRLVA